MKKLIILVLALAMCLSFNSCDGNDSGSASESGQYEVIKSVDCNGVTANFEYFDKENKVTMTFVDYPDQMVVFYVNDEGAIKGVYNYVGEREYSVGDFVDICIEKNDAGYIKEIEYEENYTGYDKFMLVFNYNNMLDNKIISIDHYDYDPWDGYELSHTATAEEYNEMFTVTKTTRTDYKPFSVFDNVLYVMYMYKST